MTLLDEEVTQYMNTLNYSEKEKLLKYLLMRYYKKDDIQRTEYELCIGNFRDGYYNPKKKDDDIEFSVNGT